VTQPKPYFESVLVANRGEIAVRIMRTLAALGIRSVAVYSDADADSLHVAVADEAVRIGPTPAMDSYLRVDRIIAAALDSGAQAIHPGYGFLSENAALAQACIDNGIVFIGPPASVIDSMGDKIRAKEIAIQAGVPVVPGDHRPAMSDAQLRSAITTIGFPALLKPSAGGGGKGMRIVRAKTEIDDAITSARREARGSFGDDTMLVERFVDRPRHIEVQILADKFTNVVHLGERECSLQRRHQKVIEESPSPLLDEGTRELMCKAAVALAAAVDYVGVGTVEFVVPGNNPADFAFLEMNTRLQVEHPVTEAVTGIDLVAEQIRIAAGHALGYTQQEVVFSGAAVEARVYAEDPTRDFLPTGGQIEVWETPTGLRIDSGVRSGDEVSSHYDPMLAKVISWAPQRSAALALLAAGLDEMIIFGVVTNIDYLRQILRDESVVAGTMDTDLLGRTTALDAWSQGPSGAAAAAMVNAFRSSLDGDGDSWTQRDGWRVWGRQPFTLDFTRNGQSIEVCEAAPKDVQRAITEHDVLVIPDVTPAPWLDPAGASVWVHSPTEGTHHGRLSTPTERHLRVDTAGDRSQAGDWSARAPMPGTIVSVLVGDGDEVDTGAPLVAVEAMKMEHMIKAPAAGRVKVVNVEVGEQVQLDQELVELVLGTVNDEGNP